MFFKSWGNLKEIVNKKLNLDKNKLLELLQIYDETYYYGKSFGKTHLYQVPSNKECKILLT